MQKEPEPQGWIKEGLVIKARYPVGLPNLVGIFFYVYAVRLCVRFGDLPCRRADASQSARNLRPSPPTTARQPIPPHEPRNND